MALVVRRGATKEWYFDLYLGGDITKPYIVTGLDLWFTAKEFFSDSDTNAKIKKTETNMEISVHPRTGVANRVLVHLNPADTSGLQSKGITLHAEFMVKDGDNNVWKALDDDLIVLPDVQNSAA